MTRNASSDTQPVEPLFAVAMLRIALELKKNPQASLEPLVTAVVQRMKLDGPAFRHHLEVNLGLLRASAPSVTPARVRASAPPRRTQRG